jgi:hypothetical protein
VDFKLLKMDLFRAGLLAVLFLVATQNGRWETSVKAILAPYPISVVVPKAVSSQPEEALQVQPSSDCLMCHSEPTITGIFPDGTARRLRIDENAYANSVHGPAGLECIACHTETSIYPHHSEQIDCTSCHDNTDDGYSASNTEIMVDMPYNSPREMTLAINEACRSCHAYEFEVAGDSAHVRVYESGNLEAPVCTDCHGSHDIGRPDEPRYKISQTCASCHKSVYSSYRVSIHGEALLEDANPDVPTCVDCHGVHSVRGPRDVGFRNDSIAICGSCHADEEMMAKYDISTEVFETYLDDFHGRTVNLASQQQGADPSNKAVCFDCHGIHNIRSHEDPASQVYPTNLQHTCQQCHDDASIQFPQAWLSHYIPSREQTPVLYAVDTVYPILIIATVGGFSAYIGLDVRKRWSEKKELERRALADEEEEDLDFF